MWVIFFRHFFIKKKDFVVFLFLDTFQSIGDPHTPRPCVVADTAADMEVHLVADKAANKQKNILADMELDMEEDKEVDKVADMVAGHGCWLIGPKLFRPEPLITDLRVF